MGTKTKDDPYASVLRQHDRMRKATSRSPSYEAPRWLEQCLSTDWTAKAREAIVPGLQVALNELIWHLDEYMQAHPPCVPSGHRLRIGGIRPCSACDGLRQALANAKYAAGMWKRPKIGANR